MAHVSHDHWPLSLMRQRAGEPLPEVEVRKPESQEELIAILRSGRRLVPAGGRSGVMGALAPEAGEVLLDLSAFDRVEIDASNLTVRAGCGVNGLRLEEELNQQGLTLGHFPSSLPITSVGGLIATRSSGQQSTYYGNIEDMVEALTVILPDGTVCAARPGPRSAAGPRLEEIFLGSEGGLGIVLEAVLRVRRLPEQVVGRGYDFPRLEEGLEAMRRIVQRDIRPLVMRLYDVEDTLFQSSDASGCLLVVATAGATGVAEAEARVVKEECGQAKDLGEAPFERWRTHRFSLSAEVLKASLQAAGSFVDTIEIAAAWNALPDLHREVKAALGAHGLALCHFSHAYAQGCCAYFTFAGSAESEAEAEAAYVDCWRRTMAASLKLRATISHHHGVGQGRAAWLAAELDGWLEVWRRVRQAVDPQAVMNPDALGDRERA